MNVVPSSGSTAAAASAFSKQHQQQHQAAADSGDGVLSLYDEIPELELSLDQFEVYALKRLKVCYSKANK